jgi:hypothetical protein
MALEDDVPWPKLHGRLRLKSLAFPPKLPEIRSQHQRFWVKSHAKSQGYLVAKSH